MYQIPGLQKFPNLIHGFSTVDGGNMSYNFNGYADNKNVVLNNRNKFLKKLNISTDNCVCLWVVHGDRIYVARKKDAGISMKDKNSAIKADALITNEEELCLFVLTGDCLPIILYCPTKQVVGVVHAGWKGVDLNIVSKTLRSLSSKYKCKVEDLVVGIGPAARKQSYIKESPSQVNDPKWQGFLEKVTISHSGALAIESRKNSARSYRSPAKAGFLQDDKRTDYYKVDFVGLCKKQLLDSGVREENIFDCAIDTVKDKRFFSHYRDKGKNIERQGRFACVVGIR